MWFTNFLIIFGKGLDIPYTFEWKHLSVAIHKLTAWKTSWNGKEWRGKYHNLQNYILKICDSTKILVIIWQRRKYFSINFSSKKDYENLTWQENTPKKGIFLTILWSKGFFSHISKLPIFFLCSLIQTKSDSFINLSWKQRDLRKCYFIHESKSNLFC